MKPILFSTLLLLVISCSAQKETLLTPDAFEQQIQQKSGQILDVRTATEYGQSHLANALQADWTNREQFKDRVQYLDKTTPLYVYCLSGGRSAAAAQWLRDAGYQQVYELEGGINAWKRNNKSLEVVEQEAQMTETMYQQLINSAPTVLVDFGATWCPPCKKMEPILEALQKEAGSRYKLVKVDGGKDQQVMQLNQVEALPVFIIYKNGKEVWRQKGVVAKEVLLKQL
jgi:rhodanese-related sulfurtransferase/glutaredoxin